MLRSDSGAIAPEDSPELAAFRSRVRRDLAGALKPRDPLDVQPLGSHIYDVGEAREYMATLHRLGYAAPHWPVEHGGMGASDTMADVIDDELEDFDVPNLYPFFVALFPVAAGVIAYGTPEQQQRWLPPILRGEDVWCQLFSEPDAGSDLAGVRTVAVRDGDVWRLTGSKVWASRAMYARWGYLLARTNSDVAKHAGLTMFALDMEAEGFENHPMRQMNGAANFSQLFLDEVVVPDSDRIGPVDAGWKVVGASLGAERLAANGGSGFSLERILQLATAPGVGRGAVGRERVVRLVTALKLAQWTAERARQADRLGRPGPSASQGKLQNSRLIIDLARAAVDLWGATELAWEGEPSDWQREFLTSPAASLRGGTDEIQKNIIAERDLGLPREPRSS